MELDYIGKIDPRGDVEKLSKYFKFRDVSISYTQTEILDLLEKFSNFGNGFEKMCQRDITNFVRCRNDNVSRRS